MKRCIKYFANRLCFFLLYTIAHLSKAKYKRNNKQIVWFGAYGNSNKGDDLIFHALNKYIPSDYVINLSCRDLRFAKEYGVRTFQKGENVFSIFRNIKEFRKCSVFILGGGGLFESYDDSEDSQRLKLAYISPFLLAKIFGLRTLVIGVGCNKTHSSSKLVEKGLTFLYSNADVIITRDNKSLEGLSEHSKIINSNAYWTFDPVFTLPTNKVGKEKYVSFLLWPYYLWPEFYNKHKLKSLNKHKRQLHALFVSNIKSSIEIVRKKGYTPIFPEFHFSDKLLIKEIGEEGMPCNKSQYMEIIGKSSLVITMRYHGQITAMLNNTPFISFVVQEKMKALVENMNIERFSFTSLTMFDIAGFEKMFDDALVYNWTSKFLQFELFKNQVHQIYTTKVYNFLNNI